MSVGGKSSQLVPISSFASQLDKDVDRIAAATISELSQLIEIASLASQLDKLVNRVLVPSLCLMPQLQQIGIKHGRTSSASLVSTGRYLPLPDSEAAIIRWVPDHRLGDGYRPWPIRTFGRVDPAGTDVDSMAQCRWVAGAVVGQEGV
jgi:hypothetical protein